MQRFLKIIPILSYMSCSFWRWVTLHTPAPGCHIFKTQGYVQSAQNRKHLTEDGTTWSHPKRFLLFAFILDSFAFGIYLGSFLHPTDDNIHLLYVGDFCNKFSLFWWDSFPTAFSPCSPGLPCRSFLCWPSTLFKIRSSNNLDACVLYMKCYVSLWLFGIGLAYCMHQISAVISTQGRWNYHSIYSHD